VFRNEASTEGPDSRRGSHRISKTGVTATGKRIATLEVGQGEGEGGADDRRCIAFGFDKRLEVQKEETESI